uniref:U-myrmeciitoxin(01)-Mg4a n=1 Tax=Myrmecia gulosa TaxID=36170 RepID=TX14A_MYRGU|nr:RecName: Full=U-myrmeciitoxin(01)-Mg4a; Short=MIITX(01)-Mg4a; Short=U-MIITX(01)-Mg4a; Flags: Precursor [Myrmecia gulosa]
MGKVFFFVLMIAIIGSTFLIEEALGSLVGCPRPDFLPSWNRCKSCVCKNNKLKCPKILKGSLLKTAA